MRVIDNTTVTNGIELTAIADDPVLVTSSSVISTDESFGSALAGESVKGQPDYNFPWFITNFGQIDGAGADSAGIGLFGGGTVFNEGSITGAAQGVYAGYQPATVLNFGLISASGTGGRGVLLADGGEVVNGGQILNGVIAKDAPTTLINSGTISGNAKFAVYFSFSYGGVIQNGSSGSTGAVINGASITGVAGTVVNYGTMGGAYAIGVELNAGGSFSNAQPGAELRQAIVIDGHTAGTVTNLGTVQQSNPQGDGVDLFSAGGTVINGSSSVTTALIEGAQAVGYGVSSEAIASVTNYATISARIGVFLSGGGSVANTGTAALIAAGALGVLATRGVSATVINTGTISASQSTATTYGVGIGAGDVVNGSSTATAAQIIADPPGANPTPIGASIKSTGVGFANSGTLANYGTVAGARTGVAIPAGTVGNGSAGTRTALIEGGYYGVQAAGTVTQSVAITNFGTIAAVGTAGVGIDFAGTAGNTVSNYGTVSGAGGTAVAFGVGDDKLVVRPGAVFDGIVDGGAGNNEIDFHTAGKISIASEFVGFATVRLIAADNLALKPSDLAGLAGDAITVVDGNAGDTVSAALLTAKEQAIVRGGAGNDIFVGGAGRDIFTGGAGADTFDFSATTLASSDMVAGGAGADVLIMTSAGTVAAAGVSGVETYRLANVTASRLRLTAGNFIGTSATAIRVVDGNAGDTVDAGALATADRITVTGGSGNDVFIGGPGKDLFTGNAGADTFRFSVVNLTAGDVVTGGAGSDTLLLMSTGTVGAGRVSQVETYRLANGGANRLTLTPGNFAGATAATITVEGGNSGNTVDAHQAGAGDRVVMIGGLGKDVFTGGAGNDTFRFSVVNLTAGDVVTGGGGNDTLLLTSAGTVAVGGISQVETYRLGNGGANKLSLTAGNFAGVTGATITVEGGTSGNTIDGHRATANDRMVMIGGAGKDVFTGGPGNDIFKFSASSLGATDTVKGGPGNDQLLMTSAGKIAATGVSGIETYRLASAGTNTLSLTNASFAGISAATITVIGGGKGNTLGEAGVSPADLAVLVGGAGADVLIAGRHARLTGGGGADQFIFTTPASTDSPDANTITDFAHGIDKIVFHDAGFNLGADEGKGTATPQRIAKSLFSPDTDGSFATAANRFAYNVKTGVLFYDADGSGTADASQRIATLTHDPAVTAGDLFFIK